MILLAPAAARAPASAATSDAVELPATPSGVWPLWPRPVVVAGFDPPATRWGSGHRGVDLAGGPLARVRSALPGVVVFAGQLAGRGVVVVDHGGIRTTYEPVAPVVRKGDRVAAGDTLGRLQLFGSHCFPRWCLHWGLIEGREHYLDPLSLVGAAPVRLLPLAGRRHFSPVPPLTSGQRLPRRSPLPTPTGRPWYAPYHPVASPWTWFSS